MNALPEGLYEQVVTRLLQERLQEMGGEGGRFFVQRQGLDKADAAIYLSRLVQKVFLEALESHAKGEVGQQIALTNHLISWLAEKLAKEEYTENLVETGESLLRAVYDRFHPKASDLKAHVSHILPHSGLAQSELFTGAHAGLSLETELRREILSADEIWWLVSFIKWTGIRIFAEQLGILFPGEEVAGYHNLVHGGHRSESR